LALALILVPSNAMVPSFTIPNSLASTATCTNNSLSTGKCRSQKSQIVRCEGKLPAPRNRNAISSNSFLAILREEYSRGIPVHQNLHQHRRSIRLITPPIPFITGIKYLQVQPIDDFAHKINQVILRQPFRKRRRQQKILLRLVGKEEVGID